MKPKTLLIITFFIFLFVSNFLTAEETFPVGMVAAFPTDTVPAGFVECDGRVLLRASYPELFAVIGTSYGTTAADNFKLPDYRGQFLRGWSHGSGTDPNASTRTDRGDGTTGDVVGSKQADEFKSHNHSFPGYKYSTADHVRVTANDNGGAIRGNINTSSAGGSETRPKNINVAWCMRVTPFSGGSGTPVFTGTNVYAGESAGLNNTAGTNNVFLGYRSGRDETGSNKLYIANSETTTPLIYGEFNNSKLQVNGELRVTNGILANKVTVKLQTSWPDYVFAKDYKLPSLEEVEKHITEKQHLPGIPSAKEIEKNGLALDEVVTKQMEKIEELTLYLIEKEKQIEKLKIENNSLKQTAEELVKNKNQKDEMLNDILSRLKSLENQAK